VKFNIQAEKSMLWHPCCEESNTIFETEYVSYETGFFVLYIEYLSDMKNLNNQPATKLKEVIWINSTCLSWVGFYWFIEEAKGGEEEAKPVYKM
jgi:hypothetical protein